ncbi:MAG TPA: hypothetical protein VGK73_14435 [Polyangiaceae bacterium]
MKTFHFVTAFGLVTAMTTAALACGGGEHKAGADANKDGKITLDEATTALKTRFAAVDANKDNSVTSAELGDRGKRMFERADANKDGKVTLAEAQTALGQWFTQRDKNGDKVLSGDEMHRGHGRGHGPRA